MIIAAALIGFACTASTPGGAQRRRSWRMAHASRSRVIDDAFARAIPAHVKPSLPRFALVAVIGGRSGSARSALLYALRAGTSSRRWRRSTPRWRWSPSAAPMRCSPIWRSRRSRHYHWLKPSEMLVGLGFAETTPGPLISVVQFVGFLAAFRAPGALAADAGRTARRHARHVDDLRAVLSLDFPGRPLCRSADRQQGA